MKCNHTYAHSSTVSQHSLAHENHQYQHTGGVSENNSGQGFVPAFLDSETGNVYRSCFPDGRPAPMHLLTGLPDELIVRDSRPDCELRIKSSVVSGFLRNDTFYTREQAAALLAETRKIH